MIPKEDITRVALVIDNAYWFTWGGGGDASMMVMMEVDMEVDEEADNGMDKDLDVDMGEEIHFTFLT